MHKGFLAILISLAAVSLYSCKEVEEASEYTEEEWNDRNTQYLESIAAVANRNLGDEVGQWKVIRNYKLPSSSTSIVADDVDDFVYARILRKGEGTVSPLYTDSVDVSYKGRLIPTSSYPEGYVFDSNYYGEMTESELPVLSTTGWVLNSGLVTAWPTALMRMHAGDIWRVYCPYGMGYGESGSSSIPGYSTLIFDIYVRKVISKH